MPNEDYVVAGIRQQIKALERLLQELRSDSSPLKKVAPRIRRIEAQLKSLRDSTTPSSFSKPPLS